MAATYANDVTDQDYSPLLVEFPESPRIRYTHKYSESDDEHYGCPSDGEEGLGDEIEPNCNSYSSTISKRDDDQPLADEESVDVLAAHDRIIRHEKARQNNVALMILEGKVPASNQSQSIQRSRSMPHRRKQGTRVQRAERSPKPPTYPGLQRSRPSTLEPKIQSTSSLMQANMSSSAGIATGSRRAVTAPIQTRNITDTSYDVNTPHLGWDKQMKSVQAAMAKMNIQSPSQGVAQNAMRIFLQTTQKYLVVPMHEKTVVWNALQYIFAQGGVPTSMGAHNNWAIFDVLPDLSLERPLREYERLYEVSRARGSNTGFFLVKMVDWPELLRAASIPSFSSILGGFVSIQAEDGWTRRWLELREHAIFVAKSETSKPDGCICSMLDVDIYLGDPQRNTGPKGFSFALRTQGSHATTLLLAAQTDEAAHNDWFKNIYRARSYVLCQERPDLLKAARAVERTEQKVASIRRTKSVRKQAALQRSNAAQHSRASSQSSAPLIQNDAFHMQFERGSLLDSMERSKPIH